MSREKEEQLVVYIKMPGAFLQHGKVLKRIFSLYGLKKSPEISFII